MNRPNIGDTLVRLELAIQELAEDMETNNRALTVILNGKPLPIKVKTRVARILSNRKPRKIRGDAKLKILSKKHQAQIVRWIADMTLKDAQEKVQKVFKISVGVSTLSVFHTWYFSVNHGLGGLECPRRVFRNRGEDK